MKSDPKQDAFIRLQAIHFFYRGFNYQEVKKIVNVSEKTFRTWISKFNKQGVDGLITKARSGRPRKWSKDKVKETIPPIFKAPPEQIAGKVTVTKLTGYVNNELQEKLSYSTLLRYVHEADYRNIVPRKFPAKIDEEKRLEFLNKLKQVFDNKSISLYYGDEAGFEADGRPRRTWIKKGEKATHPYHGIHIRKSVIGAVNPTTGKLVSIIMDHTDSEVFQKFIDILSDETKKEQVVLVLDNASWHKAKKLVWHNITPLYLPPYSPDLNPIEQLWLQIKENFFSNWHTKTPDGLEDRLVSALLAYINNPDLLTSICKISYAR